MPEWSAEYQELWNAIYQARDAESLLEHLDTAVNSGRFVPREASSLALSVFRQLPSATLDRPDVARDVILKQTLDFCLARPPEGEAEWATQDHQGVRDVLQKWIEQYPEKTQLDIIHGVHGSLLPILDSEDGDRACLILSALGYRETSVVEALFNTAIGVPHFTVYCVDALVSCGVISDDRLPPLVEQLVESDKPHRAVFALSRMNAAGNSALIERCITRLSEQGHYLAYGLSVISIAVARHYDHEELHDWYWGIAQKHRNIVLMDGRLAGALDSIKVVPDLIELLLKLTEIEDEGMRVWRVANRVSECTRPRQLASWKASFSAEARGLIRRVATQDTGSEGDYSSVQGDAKLAAWKFLLSLGCDDIGRLLSDAIPTETSRHVQGELMELAACFAISPLPESIVRLIEEEFDCEPKDVKAFVQREGGIAVARSAASYEAFQSLLNFGYTYGGHVLLKSSDALSEVAVFLCPTDDRIVPALVKQIAKGQRPTHREAACRALSYLGSTALIDRTYVEQIVANVHDKDLPAYARADLITALHKLTFDRESETTEIVAALANDAEEERVFWECCVFLIRQPFWEAFVPLIWKRIGWNGEETPPSDPDQTNGWRGWLVGELFLKDPARFAQALVNILGVCTNDTCYQLSRCLTRGTVFPDAVGDAVEDRVVNAMTPYETPSYLFAMLGRIDHGRLVSERVLGARNRWTIEAKAAYLEALATVVSNDTEFTAKRVAVLDAMSGDGAVPVRRAANLALTKSDANAFIDLWRNRANDASLLMRLRAAESVEFLPTEIVFGGTDHDLRQLTEDGFRQVRSATGDAILHADRRYRGQVCLERVTAVRTQSQDELTNAFPYGEALKKLGNNETISALRGNLAGNELPPNAHAWIRQIIKAIEKSRDDDDREVSRGWDTILEHFDGTLTVGESVYDATFDLWRVPQESFKILGYWGGTAVLKEPSTARVVHEAFEAGEAVVEAEHRDSATVVVTRTKPDSIIVVKGSGRYPAESKPT
ncbi:MAG: hypothetical protein WD049_06730 [Candidatus Paceibacterota bacterium]